MLLRAKIVLLALAALTACGSAKAGKLMVDSPAMPYVAPDIDELTGIDSEAEPAAPAAEPPASTPTAPAPAPAPTPAKK
ncbi:MAG: hypothetical protein H6Q90_4135 [Deltaproteobacteria bacterium]|nr:hypothetical protein [Deltaproteobacteria bacterium]